MSLAVQPELDQFAGFYLLSHKCSRPTIIPYGPEQSQTAADTTTILEEEPSNPENQDNYSPKRKRDSPI